MTETQKIVLILIFMAGMVVGAFYGGLRVAGGMEREAVENGAARYNPQTAAFEWLPPPNDR